MPSIGDYNSKITPYNPGQSPGPISAPNFAGPEGSLSAAAGYTRTGGELADAEISGQNAALNVASTIAQGVTNAFIGPTFRALDQAIKHRQTIINTKNKMADISATSDIVTDARQQVIAQTNRYAQPTGDTNQFNDEANDKFLEQHNEIWDSKLKEVQARNNPESLKTFYEAKNESTLATTRKLFELQQKAQEGQAKDRWANMEESMTNAVIEQGTAALPDQLALLNNPDTLKAAVIAGKGTREDIQKLQQNLLETAVHSTQGYLSNSPGYTDRAKGNILAGLTKQLADVRTQQDSLLRSPLYKDMQKKDQAIKSLDELSNAVDSDRKKAIQNLNAENTTVLLKNINDVARAEVNGDASSIVKYGQVFADELEKASKLPSDQQDPQYIKELVSAQKYVADAANAVQTRTTQAVNTGVEVERGKTTDQIQLENRQRELDRQQAEGAHASDAGVLQRNALLEAVNKKNAQYDLNPNNSGLHARDIADLKTLWNDARAHKYITPTEADKILHGITKLQNAVQPTTLAPGIAPLTKLWSNWSDIGHDFKGASEGLVKYVDPKTKVELGKLNDAVNAAYAQIATPEALAAYKKIPGAVNGFGNLTPETYALIWQKANETVGARYAAGAVSQYQMPPARKAEVKPQKPGIIQTPGGRKPAGNFFVPPPPPVEMTPEQMKEYDRMHPR
jgi:hypothetical protein